jgi:hypothetical protein
MKEFLGPYGKSTIVLMQAQFESELPKLKDLKRLLNISDGLYYKASGRHSRSVEQLTNCLTLIAGGGQEESVTCPTHYLITQSDVYKNDLLLMQYAATIIAGFNLTEAAMKELKQLLQTYHQLNWRTSSCRRFKTTLEENQEWAEQTGVEDPTLRNPNYEACDQVLNDYGTVAEAQVTAWLTAWYDKYYWKTRPPKNAIGLQSHQTNNGVVPASATSEAAHDDLAAVVSESV